MNQLFAPFWLMYGTMAFATALGLLVWMAYDQTWMMDIPEGTPWWRALADGASTALVAGFVWPIVWPLFFGGDGRWRG